VALVLLAVSVSAIEDACHWKNEQNVVYNFNTFSNDGLGYHFQYKDHGDTYELYIALCEPLKTSPCQPKTNVCQEWDNGTGKKTIGKDDPPPTFKTLDANTVEMTMANGEQDPNGVCKNNNAILNLVCDPNKAADPEWSYLKVDIVSGLCSYKFSVSHKNACVGGGAGGLSGGSILLIIGFCVFALYCAIGAAYQFKVKEARGVEMVPNNAFWFQLPGLVKEGMRFTFFTLTRRSDYAPL